MGRGRKPNKIKRANGSGTVYKLSGNRRKPYAAFVTLGYDYNDDTKKATAKRKALGYYATEAEARDALDRFRLDPYELTNNITFKEVYNQWSTRYYATLKNKSAARTSISAFNHSTPLYDRNIRDITITMLRDTIDAANVGPSTKGRMKSLYNLMFDYAVESRYIDVNIARQFNIKNLDNEIKQNKKDKIPFSLDHVNKCIEYYDYKDMRMVLIALYTGLRPRELCELLRENVHLDEGYIIGGMKTAAGTNRYIPIHEDIKPYIEYYYNISSGLYLIEAHDGQNNNIMTYDKYRSRYKACMRFIGADGLYSPHCTRHTFITQAKKCGLDDIAIKQIVGHEIADVTESVYTHRGNEYLHNQINKFSYTASMKKQNIFKIIS